MYFPPTLLNIPLPKPSNHLSKPRRRVPRHQRPSRARDGAQRAPTAASTTTTTTVVVLPVVIIIIIATRAHEPTRRRGDPIVPRHVGLLRRRRLGRQGRGDLCCGRGGLCRAGKGTTAGQPTYSPGKVKE